MKTALDTLYNILSNEYLSKINFRFCLVNEQKLPFQLNGSMARPNQVDDFFKISDIKNIDILEKYVGLGFSIQGSNICAIDVDHCFSKPFDISSIDNRGKDIIEMFKDLAYIEYSFSGTGLRILFCSSVLEDYSEKYYIKNSKNNIEYYYPEGSYRYVTITGKSIYNNDILATKFKLESTLITFLNKYMRKEIKQTEVKKVIHSSVDIKKGLRKLLLTDFNFQNEWFNKNHEKVYDKEKGWISLESDKDYYIIKTIYENITTDKDTIKEIFETSPFFKSKDAYHVKKWEYNNNRYYNYIYEHL